MVMIDIVQGKIKIAFETRLSNMTSAAEDEKDDNDGSAALAAASAVPSVASRGVAVVSSSMEGEEEKDVAHRLVEQA